MARLLQSWSRVLPLVCLLARHSSIRSGHVTRGSARLVVARLSVRVVVTGLLVLLVVCCSCVVGHGRRSVTRTSLVRLLDSSLVCRWCVVGVSLVCRWCVVDLSLTCRWCVVGVSLTCRWCVVGVSLVRRSSICSSVWSCVCSSQVCLSLVRHSSLTGLSVRVVVTVCSSIAGPSARCSLVCRWSARVMGARLSAGLSARVVHRSSVSSGHGR